MGVCVEGVYGSVLRGCMEVCVEGVYGSVC